MKNTTTKGDATLEGWRHELAAANLGQVKRPKPIEQWVGKEHMRALDIVLRAVAFGAELRIAPAPLLGTIDASLDSSGGVRHAKASGEKLGDVLAELAHKWGSR